jgi:D-glycero-D-manno-heptose 1,7-bisphosphate phosphatase
MSLIERPTQAVILAGGRGTRMRPLTEDRPKPMVEVGGRPFLEYLLEMLRDQGFDRALLLLGYLPEVVQDHFGDGADFGIQIDYSVTEPDDLTTSRVQRVRERLDPSFLLMYCDNYWPMRMDDMWARFQALEAPAMVTVYSNKDDYRPGKDSMLVDEQGYVRAFDKSRVTPGLRGVEISYAVLTEPVLDLLPDEDELIEEALYPKLAARGQLGAYVTDHRYYSGGDLERLEVTERFLTRRPAVILDRDGVLNKRPPKAEYVTGPDEFEWLPGAREALALLKAAGYLVVVVSNQAGIARGAMTEADLAAVHGRVLEETDGAIAAIYHCPHGWDDGCECRKPRPGMLFQAQREHDLDLTRTPFLGDDERDGEAAAAAGCPFTMIDGELSLFDAVRELVAEKAVAR